MTGPLRDRIEHVIHNELVSSLTLDQCSVEILNRLAPLVGRTEGRFPDNQAMREWSLRTLILWVDGKPHRPELHLDNRMVPVTPLRDSRQYCEVLRPDVGQYALK